MGLAASQARMLLLTSRKNDVESQLMSISNQKLSLSRDSAKLSEKYSNALNAKTLAWAGNSDGTTSNLAYSELMGESAITGNSSQYLLTNTSGQVVLNSTLQSKLGLTSSGNAGDISSKYDTKTKFLEALGISDTTTVNKALANNGASENIEDTSTFSFTYEDQDIIAAAGLYEAYNTPNITLDGSEKYITNKRKNINKNVAKAEAEIYSNSGSTTIENFASTLDDIVGSLTTALKTSAGSQYSSYVINASEYARNATYDKFIYNYNDENATDNQRAPLGSSSTNWYNAGDIDNNDDSINSLQYLTAATGKNRITIATNTDEGPGAWNWSNGDDFDTYAATSIDIAQLINTFLTYFDQYLAQNYTEDENNNGVGDGTIYGTIGADSTIRGSQGGVIVAESNGDDDDADDNISTTDENSNNISDSTEALYYLHLYDAIDSVGWKVDSNAENDNYLQNALLYGGYQLYKYDGGWESASTSDADSPLVSVDDEDAVEQAAADYEAGKDKLDYKESILDIQQTNLDTERSAIETDVQSVQEIINKNIERSFKMFQA